MEPSRNLTGLESKMQETKRQWGTTDYSEEGNFRFAYWKGHSGDTLN